MYIDLIFYKFTSNLTRQLLIKVISVLGEKKGRVHETISYKKNKNMNMLSNAIYVLHWEQMAEYFEIIVFLLQNFLGQYIFLFLWSDQVMYNALSTHKLTPVRANVCPSPFIVSNGLENFSAILRALIQALLGRICVLQTVNQRAEQYFSGEFCSGRYVLAIIHKNQVNRNVHCQS
ncbi:hypothetical protein [Escherichia coli]|uniref:hypothetical protein n=1 Tax=Escherichia coli TaxID=562 RepID=UPI003B27E89A